MYANFKSRSLRGRIQVMAGNVTYVMKGNCIHTFFISKSRNKLIHIKVINSLHFLYALYDITQKLSWSLPVGAQKSSTPPIREPRLQTDNRYYDKERSSMLIL